MGMSLRMAQELGLHREHSSSGSFIGQSPADSGPQEKERAVYASPLNYVDSSTFERSAHITLFWCIFIQDTCLSSGTGRVPSIKRHEISIRLPEDMDIAIIQAGPGGVPAEIGTCAFPYTVRMMQTYAASIEFLNTESGNDCHTNSSAEAKQRMAQIEQFQSDIIQTYRLIPQEIRFGAIFYQAAVKSHQAGPYLLLHLYFHLQIAFLTQERLAVDEALLAKPDDTSATSNVDSNLLQRRKSAISLERKATEGLYRNAIKSITDLLTIAKLIDDRTILASFFLNQSFFHAACAYIRDMNHQSATTKTTLANGPSAFPIPNEASPSMVLHVEDYHEDTMLPTGSKAAAESTFSYLSLIAKANYQFLRQSVKDMAEFYAGAGWVDAVLDQRETGLRDVDLSIVSDKISTFIRLHDLRGRHINGQPLKVSCLAPAHSNCNVQL